MGEENPLVLAGIIAAMVLGVMQPEPKTIPDDSIKEAREAAASIQWLIWHEGLALHPPLTSEPAPDSPNAALRYLWLLARLDPGLRKAASALARSPGFAISDSEEDITIDEIRATLIDHQAWIEALIEASKLAHFDFGASSDPMALYDEEDGRKVTFHWRSAAFILAADAKRLAVDGDPTAATERVIAISRMARHGLAMDQSGIAGLVGIVVLCRAAEMTLEIQDRLSDESRAALLAELESFDARDPAAHHARWSALHQSKIAFARRHLEGDRLGLPLRTSMLNIGKSRIVYAEPLEPELTLEQMLARSQRLRDLQHALERAPWPAVEEARTKLARAIELGEMLDRAWDAPDGDAVFAAADAEIEADESNLLAFVLDVPTSYRRDARDVAQRLARAIEALRAAPVPLR